MSQGLVRAEIAVVVCGCGLWWWLAVVVCGGDLWWWLVVVPCGGVIQCQRNHPTKPMHENHGRSEALL